MVRPRLRARPSGYDHSTLIVKTMVKALAIIAYLTIGIVLFYNSETKPCESDAALAEYESGDDESP